MIDPLLESLRFDDLSEIDPFLSDLIQREEIQQVEKLILVPSVSAAPRAVLQALGSSIQNVCAEGLPSVRMSRASESALHDLEWHLADNQRYGDRRFYQGVQYVDFVESLAQRRCAELFAIPDVPAKHLHVNVQALSGGTANLAVYQALLKPGDGLMGMSLYEGGHLSHGSPFNLSGQLYRISAYAVDPHTQRLDYDRIRDLARTHRPKLIVAGYTSYPWNPDWKIFRSIADEVGASLMADIAHTAGLVAAGVCPSPVGLADVITLTANKTLCGPRSALVMTTDPQLAKAVDQAIFPGQQGAPHPNKFAAVAVALQIAGTEAFRRLQRRIVANAAALAEKLIEGEVGLAYGGTDTHLLVIDLKSINPGSGASLYGEPAARILELADLVVNKNSVPGDRATGLATGLRLGTPWITQRGLDPADMDLLAGLIARVLKAIHPFTYQGVQSLLPRGKIPLEVLEQVRSGVAELVGRTHDREMLPEQHAATKVATLTSAIRVRGQRARQFMQQVSSANLANLGAGEVQPAYFFDRRGGLLERAQIQKEATESDEPPAYLVIPDSQDSGRLGSWLQALSDGYALFDEEDLLRKIEGPVVIEPADLAAEIQTGSDRNDRPGATEISQAFVREPGAFDLTKPYFIGETRLAPSTAMEQKSAWQFITGEAPLRRTPLWPVHRELGARLVPFAGWEMPLRYGSILEEHQAVRQAAGLFDVGHMGIFGVAGETATIFMDAVFSNYVAWLEEGQACYGFFLDPDGAVIDDGIVYKLPAEKYFIVVNAANEARVWDWLNRVNNREVLIDRRRPWIQVEAPAILADLKQPSAGEMRLCDLALQGPASQSILLTLIDYPADRSLLTRLGKNHLIQSSLAGLQTVIARTGYTGEEWGYELFIHPDQAVPLWQAIFKAGEASGVRPAGLGARDSLRTEAGLPLWGRELGGDENISPIEAGFPGYVKYHKPFFVGREALLARAPGDARSMIRFRIEHKSVRLPHLGDPILDTDGTSIGSVTSCSLDGRRRLIGMAVIDRRAGLENGPIGVLPGRRKNSTNASSATESTPVPVEILDRFLHKP